MRTVFLKSSNGHHTGRRGKLWTHVTVAAHALCQLLLALLRSPLSAVAALCGRRSLRLRFALPHAPTALTRPLFRAPCVGKAIDGRYFGELTRQLLDRAERKYSKYQDTMELRISVYGIDGGEWARLAKWVLTPWQGADGQPPRPLISHANRWIIQIPRLYSLFRGKRGADGQPQVKAPASAQLSPFAQLSPPPSSTQPPHHHPLTRQPTLVTTGEALPGDAPAHLWPSRGGHPPPGGAPAASGATRECRRARLRRRRVQP